MLSVFVLMCENLGSKPKIFVFSIDNLVKFGKIEVSAAKKCAVVG